MCLIPSRDDLGSANEFPPHVGLAHEDAAEEVAREDVKTDIYLQKQGRHGIDTNLNHLVVGQNAQGSINFCLS